MLNKVSTIYVDTREQLPLWQRNILKKKLDVGDYTTELLYEKFHIERKSPQDLYGSIIQGHVRFRNEILRAQVYSIKLVIFVESTHAFFVDKKFPGGSQRKTSGETLKKMMRTIEGRYKVEVVWCKSRNVLKREMIKRLMYEETTHKKEQRKIKKAGNN